MKINSLRKSIQILRRTYHLFQKKKKSLSLEAKSRLQQAMTSLQTEIMAKRREDAHHKALELQNLAKVLLRKTPFEQGRDLIFGVGCALAIAVLVRLTWFELYEIPTGSMRPTLKEHDRLIVSKTDFGINFPLKPEHIYFNPELTKRSGIFVFTGENMDIRDVDTLYFYIFPGKKQYIKRLMGKPGDTLYFYGGLIYGIDEHGHDISKELQLPELNRIDHVPYIHFEGKVKTGRKVDGIYSPVVFYQMNEAIAEMSLTVSGKVASTLMPPFEKAENYSNLFGMNHYAMARLVTKNTINPPQNLEEGILYLELKHHPNLNNAKVAFDEYGRLRPMMALSTSYIPLQMQDLQTLMANLYTARFEVKDGIALRYGSNKEYARPFAPSLPGVPDGSYEFYYGKAYKIYPQGIEIELASDHPLYQFSPEKIQLLFNLGMEFDTRFSKESNHTTLMPARFAYFRNQDLYVAGAKLFNKENPTLAAFVEKESKTSAPFIDSGPPLTADGSIDSALINQYGLKIPPKMYLALGDNYAMSADS
ncbi:MAG: signal peptidase I, partial [Chlamydiota bacterium]